MADLNTRSELVSVIVPTYRRSEFLERAIDSVSGQTYPHWELIVVDDNDPDSGDRRATERFMERYAEETRVRYLRHDRNLGGGAARNTGIRAARGELVAFLDDDDVWDPTKLEKQVAVLAAAHPDTALVYCGFKKVFVAAGLEKVEMPGEGNHSLETLLTRNAIGTTSAILCRREALLEVGLFDEELPSRQDVDLYVRLAARGYPFAYVPEVLLTWYRHDADSIGKNRKGVLRAHRIFDEKHRELIDGLPAVRRHRLLSLGYLSFWEGHLGDARSAFLRAARLFPPGFEPLGGYLVANPLGRMLAMAGVRAKSWLRSARLRGTSRPPLTSRQGRL